ALDHAEGNRQPVQCRLYPQAPLLSPLRWRIPWEFLPNRRTRKTVTRLTLNEIKSKEEDR
ncbi:MAG TPA: hypothetical protein PKC98_23825, partial [Candidatus Melainabacteria bacterium]|nr:hypothetical protein [Candidatus Melainabacteria bacterium]